MKAIQGRVAILPALFFCSAVSGSLLFAQGEELPALSQKANALMSAGRYEEAIPLYTQLVKALPGNSGLLLNLSLAQHMAGHEREAIPNFEAVLKLQPKSLPALLSLGAARLSVGDSKQAVMPLERAVVLDPANPDARGMLAGAYMDLGRFDRAAQQYRTVTEKSPDDPRAWYGLGMSYQGLATQAFDRLKSIDSTSPFVSALIADTRVQTRQYRSAFYFYNLAAKAMPQLHGVHNAIADVYRKTGHPEWASSEEAKEAALPAPDCKTHAAECLFLGGHDLQAATSHSLGTASAETLYWVAKASNELAMQSLFRLGQLPESPEIHQLRAEIARNRGQHLESVNEWRALLSLAPDNMRAKQELAVSLFLAQDFKAAIAQAEGIVPMLPQSAELHFILGDSWLRLEEPEKAVPYLQKALAEDSNLVSAHASLGLALARLGNNNEAIPHLEKALDLDDDGSLHYQLARAYTAAGNSDRAKAVMAKYQEILKRVQQQKEDVAREAQIGPPQ